MNPFIVSINIIIRTKGTDDNAEFNPSFEEGNPPFTIIQNKKSADADFLFI